LQVQIWQIWWAKPLCWQLRISIELWRKQILLKRSSVVTGLREEAASLNEWEKKDCRLPQVGHALNLFAWECGRLRKIIVPRGMAALGYTLQLPTEDRS